MQPSNNRHFVEVTCKQLPVHQSQEAYLQFHYELCFLVGSDEIAEFLAPRQLLSSPIKCGFVEVDDVQGSLIGQKYTTGIQLDLSLAI